MRFAEKLNRRFASRCNDVKSKGSGGFCLLFLRVSEAIAESVSRRTATIRSARAWSKIRVGFTSRSSFPDNAGSNHRPAHTWVPFANDATISQYGFGTCAMISCSRSTSRASVGVWTRPADHAPFSPRLRNRCVRARVAFIPINQSPTDRSHAASANASRSDPGRKFSNAVRIESGVIDCNQSRSIGLLSSPVYSTVRRKISSPSLPASQALMIPSTSFRLPSFWICLSRPFWPSFGFTV